VIVFAILRLEAVIAFAVCMLSTSTVVAVNAFVDIAADVKAPVTLTVADVMPSALLNEAAVNDAAVIAEDDKPALVIVPEVLIFAADMLVDTRRLVAVTVLAVSCPVSSCELVSAPAELMAATVTLPDAYRDVAVIAEAVIDPVDIDEPVTAPDILTVAPLILPADCKLLAVRTLAVNCPVHNP